MSGYNTQGYVCGSSLFRLNDMRYKPENIVKSKSINANGLVKFRNRDVKPVYNILIVRVSN